MSVWSRYIARLLHVANANPSFTHKREFYALKDRLTMTRGAPDGSDLQHIVRECWGCYGTAWAVKSCQRCGGTGVFSERYVLLQRLRWEGYVFHRPIGEIPAAAARMRPVTIKGYVQHRDVDGRDSRVAELLLVLIYEPKAFLERLASDGRFLTPGPRPLLWIQAAIYEVRWNLLPRLRPVRCYQCDRRIWRFGRNGGTWILCRRCDAVMHRDEVPF